MRIGELSKQTKVPASTIRYYEKIGLLPGIQRTSGGIRKYSEETLLRLQMIRGFKSMGLSLSELQVFFGRQEKSEGYEYIIEAIDGRLDEFEKLITDLSNKHQTLSKIKSQFQDTWKAGRCLDEKQIDELRNFMSIE